MSDYKCTNCNLRVSAETGEALRKHGHHTNAHGKHVGPDGHVLYCPNIACEDFTLVEAEAR